MTDWGRLYRDNLDAVAALASGLTEEQLATTVPATPEWTVHEVLAHLAGGASDAVTGRMDGAPSDEWTERHVGERRDRSVDELLAELRAHEDAVVDSVADSPRPAFVWNIVVHHADLHEALGLPQVPEHFWRPVLDVLAPRFPDGLSGVPPYELFRAGFSRRSRSQVGSWGTGLSPDELDELGIFGPRDDDQPVPA
jgi:uncharacterized protein (TIGR03083 family)